MTEEAQRRKLKGESNGRKLSNEHIQKIVESNIGSKRSNETKKKMSEWQKGNQNGMKKGGKCFPI